MSDYMGIIFWCMIGYGVGYFLEVTLKFIYTKVTNNKKLTPFEKAGYTKDTKFKVLRDWGSLKKGDIVTLKEDNGEDFPWFKTEEGRPQWCWLPNMAPNRIVEQLEVYVEEGK